MGDIRILMAQRCNSPREKQCVNEPHIEFARIQLMSDTGERCGGNSGFNCGKKGSKAQAEDNHPESPSVVGRIFRESIVYLTLWCQASL
jgi:hypothetical protein